MSDLITDIEQFLRTVQAVRAAVEPERVTLDDLTPGQLRAYAAQLEDDYAQLIVAREEALADCAAWQQSYRDLGRMNARLRDANLALSRDNAQLRADRDDWRARAMQEEARP